MLLIVSFFVSIVNTNFIVNGGFSSPVLASGVLNGKLIDYWNVTWIDLKNESPYMGFGQYVDLQKGISQNGWISQEIILTYNGTY